jgi:hypothetical protein
MSDQEVVMRKRGELTARERRQFEGLVRTYFELDAYDPHRAGADTSPRGAGGHGRPDRLWARWRRRLQH